jgi:CubicO group peptidase (beta-lactamase class C family)
MNVNRFDMMSRAFAARKLTRRAALAGGAAALAASSRVQAAQETATPQPGDAADPAAAIIAFAREAMDEFDLRAVILRVTIGGEEVVTTALGESMAGVPATTDMHFRNGAVAISYMSTLLLQFVDQGVAGLDDPIATWLPDLQDADRVTLRMLANMTSGYPDHVQNADFLAAFLADPFRQWSPSELIDISLSTPRLFAPGANWDYSHTGYVILGQALERIGDAPLDALLRRYVLDPLGLRDTASWDTPAIPEPVLHSFSSERRESLGIDPDTRFVEDSTFWNPSWTLAAGAIQTTTITDMATSARAIGNGALLSPESHRTQIDPGLLGFGAPLDGCPNCRALDTIYNYGLGIVMHGPWLLQNPAFAGLGAIMAYLPAQQLSIAVVSTYGDTSADGQFGNVSVKIFEAIAALLAPNDVPPQR